jgi:type IV pilus assembly protein PilW
MKNKLNQAGLFLIELLIATLIGAFLLGGVLQVFISSKQTYRMQENLSRLQENGRFALQMISRDARAAGYRQCYTAPVLALPISGTNNLGLNSSDTLIMQFMQWSKDICSVTAPLSTITYSIQTGTSGQPSLFKTLVTNGTATTTPNKEVVEGVENIQILFGADTDVTPDYTPNYYVPAGTTGLNLAQVVSLRITIWVRTMDDNLATVTANGDRRIRHAFTSTIAVRNRLP